VRKNLFWLSDKQWKRIETSPADGCAGRRAGGRSPGHQRHRACAEKRLSLVRAFNRLKDFRRIATRYDRLARNYLVFVCLAAALVWWI
jgi:hypothetical protein